MRISSLKESLMLACLIAVTFCRIRSSVELKQYLPLFDEAGFPPFNNSSKEIHAVESPQLIQSVQSSRPKDVRKDIEHRSVKLNQSTGIGRNLGKRTTIPYPIKLPSSTTGPNKTIVVALGNLRCGEKAWESLYKNVLDVNSADLALITQMPIGGYENASLLERAKYVWIVPDYTDWADAIDLINGTGWRRRVLPMVNPQSPMLGGVGNFSGSGAIIFMYRFWLSQKIQELRLKEQYDRFVVTRNDHYYLCHHNLEMLEPSSLWLPMGEDYGGITDRHLVVSSENVLKALDILPPILAHPESYMKVYIRKNSISELILRERWREEGLLFKTNRFKRVMFTCMQPGDGSRWGQMKWRVKERVHLKYENEYYLSLRSCGQPTKSWDTANNER